MSESSNSITFTYQILSDAQFDEIHIKINALGMLGRTPTAISKVDDGVELAFPDMARNQPRLRIVGTGNHTQVVADDDGVVEVVSRGSRTVQFEVAFDRSAPSINDPVVLNPRDLVNEYRIEAALLADDGTLAQRLARLEALGFEAANYAGDYLVVVQREPGLPGVGQVEP